jgi:hypothetical protein
MQNKGNLWASGNRAPRKFEGEVVGRIGAAKFSLLFLESLKTRSNFRNGNWWYELRKIDLRKFGDDREVIEIY